MLSVDTPKISIVTVVYNGEKHIEQAIQSVLGQSYDNIEYIIIDGCSTDRTLDIIQRYEDRIYYWISEPDHGIYDAMNKGIKFATGEYLAFLNADDWYSDRAIVTVASLLNQFQQKPAFVFANVDMYDDQNEKLYTFKANMKKFKVMMPFGHPTLFIQTHILKKIWFDNRYPTAADYDLVCKLIQGNYSYRYINSSLVNFRLIGVSSTVNRDKELFILHYRHFGFIIAIYAYIRMKAAPILITIRKVRHWLKNAKV